MGGWFAYPPASAIRARRRRKIKTASPMTATKKATPPTTPPAIAPALVPPGDLIVDCASPVAVPLAVGEPDRLVWLVVEELVTTGTDSGAADNGYSMSSSTKFGLGWKYAPLSAFAFEGLNALFAYVTMSAC